MLESKARYRAKKKLLMVNIGPQTLQRRANWLPCACCLAKIGCGSKVTARILGIVTHGGVRGAMRANGIKRFVPPTGSWTQAALVKITALKPSSPKKPTAKMEYEAACLRDIRSHRKLPDWSYLWRKEVATRKSNEKYHAMSDEDRKAFNLSCHLKRMACPIKRQKSRDKVKEWKIKNAEKARDQVKKSMKKRKAEDPGYRVQCNLRNRLKDLMQTVRNGGSDHISRLIGCTTKQLARHLDSKFKRGMNWDNYGTHWHVDHILPCSSFNHADERQVRQCWHYSNLAPLEAEKNLKKSATIIEPQMQLLLCSTH